MKYFKEFPEDITLHLPNPEYHFMPSLKKKLLIRYQPILIFRANYCYKNVKFNEFVLVSHDPHLQLIIAHTSQHIHKVPKSKCL